MTKVMIFIDGSNLLRTCNQFYPKTKFDQLKLRDVLVGGRELVRAYYYCSIPTSETGGTQEKIDKEMSFYRRLGYAGFKVMMLPLRKRGDKIIEKGIDIALVTDMISLAYNRAYDVGVLVSGDEDYKNAIKEIMRMGLRVEIASFRAGLGKAYRDESRPDKIIYLDDIIEKIKFIPGRQ